MKISVVVPSLGGDLRRIIDSVNRGSMIPSEIIVCLPNNSHTVESVDHCDNLKVIYAGRYGQVYQRAVGFKAAKGDYVLQLDDDILLDKGCLERLLCALEQLPEKTSVSPCLFNVNGLPMYQQKKTGILSIYYRLINGKLGYQPGAITQAGTNFGVNPAETKEDLIQVDWLPGGCVLHRKENLILIDYYPNKGKAYCEDLIHSYLLRQSGIALFVDTRAKCTTPLNPRLSLMKDLVPDIKARHYFVKLANLSIVRMWIHYVVYVVRFLKFK